MTFDVKNLKKIRKSLELTQHQFAKQCNVSQSLIAKIESGKLDPTYSKVQKIEEAIDRLSKKDQHKVGKIMVKNVITCSKNEKIVDISKIMRKKAISQLPVLEGKYVIGLITESAIIDTFGTPEIDSIKAKDIMIETPPSVSIDATVTLASSILRHYPLVLVLHQGELAGVVTKSDLLKVLTW